MNKYRKILFLSFLLGSIFSLLFIGYVYLYPNPERDFSKALNIDTIEAFGKFLTKYPSSEYSDGVKNKIIPELEFKKARQINSLMVFQEFVDKYPSNSYSHLAKIYIEILSDTDLVSVTKIKTIQLQLQMVSNKDQQSDERYNEESKFFKERVVEDIVTLLETMGFKVVDTNSEGVLSLKVYIEPWAQTYLPLMVSCWEGGKVDVTVNLNITQLGSFDEIANWCEEPPDKTYDCASYKGCPAWQQAYSTVLKAILITFANMNKPLIPLLIVAAENFRIGDIIKEAAVEQVVKISCRTKDPQIVPVPNGIAYLLKHKERSLVKYTVKALTKEKNLGSLRAKKALIEALNYEDNYISERVSEVLKEIRDN